MIPRNERFPRGHKLPRDNRVALGEFFRARSAQNGLEKNRFVVIAPKTIARGAVIRNKIRRIVHETIRSWPKQGKDILITVHKTAVGRLKHELVSDLRRMQKDIIPPQTP